MQPSKQDAAYLWDMLDAAKAVNAASVASLMLTTEVIITDLPEDKGAGMPGGMGGMGGMY